VVNRETEGTLQLQEGARRFSHTRTDRSRSGYRQRLIYAFENLG
jgi:hypothetical protein